MDEQTARKYRQAGRLPSQLQAEHTWRTRSDPFADVWHEVEDKLGHNANFEAKTLFEDLQRRYPGRFQDGQLRTLQRRVKIWRALEGPAREIYFAQIHEPGELGASDFTDMTSLGVTIQGQLFEHLIYHFALTYSNWETATICFAESFESLSHGLQNALWELGGVPKAHKTDCLSAAVRPLEHPEDFTDRYQALMRHYGLEARKTNPSSPHENGDVEQRHYRFRRAVDQALMLRGHRDFAERAEYDAFLRTLLDQVNAGRQERLAEEQAVLRELPPQRTEDYKRLSVRVSRFSTIRVSDNSYSLHSRLRYETVEVRLYAEHLDVYYAQRHLECIPRLRGKGGHRIQYRHIIDWLVRKPGAFSHYRYRDDLFPTTRFRMAYDVLCAQHSASTASRQYLRILHLAARESETQVEVILARLLGTDETLSADCVEALLQTAPDADSASVAAAVVVGPVDLRLYDDLLSSHQPAAEVVVRVPSPAPANAASTKGSRRYVCPPCAATWSKWPTTPGPNRSATSNSSSSSSNENATCAVSTALSAPCAPPDCHLRRPSRASIASGYPAKSTPTSTCCWKVLSSIAARMC